ncbi:MAG TPA: hypothetical protein VF939_26235 [Puia sp.]
MRCLLPVLLFCSFSALSQPIPRPRDWKDTEGRPINAHGAGILFHKGVYYLFGEIKKGRTWLVPGQSWEDYRVPAGGVSCYSSSDLQHWKYEGVALSPVTGDPGHDLDTGKVVERPKVIYNDKTGKFVMWMHVDARDYSCYRTIIFLPPLPIAGF